MRTNRPIVAWVKQNSNEHDDFGIILPTNFLHIPESMNFKKKTTQKECSMAGIMVCTWWSNVCNHAPTAQIILPDYLDLTDYRVRVHVTHKTDGSFTIVLPKRLHTAPTEEIDAWLHKNFNGITDWL